MFCIHPKKQFLVFFVCVERLCLVETADDAGIQMFMNVTRNTTGTMPANKLILKTCEAGPSKRNPLQLAR